MPCFETTNFGEIEYQENAVVHFPEGVPSFGSERQFLLLHRPESAPVVFLQSLTRPDLTFITLPVDAIEPDYCLQLSRRDRGVLGLEESEPPRADTTLCLAIVTIPEAEAPTVNLLAPIVIHVSKNLGLQVIQADSDYSHRHPLPLREEEC